MEKRWKYNMNFDQKMVEELAAELNLNETLARLLVQRNIKTVDQARKFFRPSLDDLHDPFEMTDMSKAVERINAAIQRNEKILFYGDYDVDGTTAVALMHSFFRKHYPHMTDYYIPDRYNEGYGVSKQGIEYAYRNGFQLVIALDCGIKAHERMIEAQQYRIDFIICDHHLPDEQIPKAYAVLDPKRSDCKYKCKDLSGCGVGFKLLQAFCTKNEINIEEVYQYLDLVAVSIASDIVPIVGENRVLAHYGLERLNTNPSRGLKAIIKTAAIGQHTLTVEDVVFRIGPRINAAGRMQSGKTAVDLLCAEDEVTANKICTLIDSCNDDRKHVDRDITHEAIRMIASDPQMQNAYATVLYNEEWHKGVVGIVASRLIETYFRPTIVLTRSKDIATGSARSVPGYDLYQAIESCSDLLENFGGHTYAAGLSLKVENIEKFRERFVNHVRQTIDPSLLIPQIDIDAKVDLENIDEKFFRILQHFQPFGPGNMAPIFQTNYVVDNGKTTLVGDPKIHLKLHVTQPNSTIEYCGFAFSQSDHYRRIHKGLPFNICYSPYKNEYRGRTSMQLKVKDIKFDNVMIAALNSAIQGMMGDKFPRETKCKFCKYHNNEGYNDIEEFTPSNNFENFDKSFKVQFIDTPQVMCLSVEKDSLKLKINLAIDTPKNTANEPALCTAYVDYPSDFDGESKMTDADLNTFYSRTMEAAQKSLNGEQKNVQISQISGYKAVKSTFAINEGKYNVELLHLLVKNRLYMMSALISNADKNKFDADKFFKSLIIN